MAFYSFFLLLHVLTGSLGLLSGRINLILKKGGEIHKTIGRVFVFSMISTALIALLLCFLKTNFFLLIIGVFTLYLVGTGQRYLYMKNLSRGGKRKIVDWLLSSAMGIVGFIFMGWGIFLLVKKNIMGWSLMLFGTIGLLSVRKDFENYLGKSRKKQFWLRAHIARIVGAYIASLSAFLVVNYSRFSVPIPEVVYWVLPTLILTPLIIYWIRKYS